MCIVIVLVPNKTGSINVIREDVLTTNIALGVTISNLLSR